MTQTAEFRISAKATQVDAPDGGSLKYECAINVSETLADGTTLGKADRVFRDTRTLASNTSENLDLAGGLTDQKGAAITFAKIKAVVITAADGNTTKLSVGGAASNGAKLWFADLTDIEELLHGDSCAHFSEAGWPVTASTADILKIANASGAAATYDIMIIGTSA